MRDSKSSLMIANGWVCINKQMHKLVSTEHQEQCAVVEYLRLQYPHVVFFAIPNGGLRNKAVAAKLKKEGVRAGVPDLFIANSYFNESWKEVEWLGLFIEMKTYKGRPSIAQIQMMNALTDANYKCVVCYSADDAIREIDSYLQDCK